MTLQQMIDRRVGKGANRAESLALLADLLRSHQGHNLLTALVYQDFATEKQAEAFLADSRPFNWDDLGSSGRDLAQERIFAGMARQLERSSR